MSPSAILAYAAAQALGGSGFIAAFAGGLAFGRAAGARDLPFLSFTEDAGEWLAAIVWIGFGALALGKVLGSITWQVVLYGIVSLTIVRMVPVALAMLGGHARRPTVAFLGWFGPRGLASIVFALIALDDHVPDARLLFTTVTFTVALSVVAHGLTSASWSASTSAGMPRTPNGAPTPPRRRPPCPRGSAGSPRAVGRPEATVRRSLGLKRS